MSNLTLFKPVEYKEQRVLTTAQLAEGYETDAQIIRNNFNRNKDRYIEGIHYYLLEGDEFQAFRTANQIDLSLKVSSMYLWTEKGALLHAKSLNTDRAWEVYQELVDTYFRAKDLTIQLQQLPPELQLFKQIFDAQAKMYVEQKRLESIALEAKQEAETVKEKFNAVKETFAERQDDWRKWVNGTFVKLNKKTGIAYDVLKQESYKLLEDRTNCDLPRRVRNARQRLMEAGSTKAVIDAYVPLSAIEDDKKLREVYTAILKEMCVKYLV